MAEAEVAEAIAFYEGQRPGLGREFREYLEDTFDRIRRMPSTPSPLDKRGTRKFRLRRFPYSVYYVELPGGCLDRRRRTPETAARLLVGTKALTTKDTETDNPTRLPFTLPAGPDRVTIPA
jgi:hypothetical protein